MRLLPRPLRTQARVTAPPQGAAREDHGAEFTGAAGAGPQGGAAGPSATLVNEDSALRYMD